MALKYAFARSFSIRNHLKSLSSMRNQSTSVPNAAALVDVKLNEKHGKFFVSHEIITY